MTRAPSLVSASATGAQFQLSIPAPKFTSQLEVVSELSIAMSLPRCGPSLPQMALHDFLDDKQTV